MVSLQRGLAAAVFVLVQGVLATPVAAAEVVPRGAVTQNAALTANDPATAPSCLREDHALPHRGSAVANRSPDLGNHQACKLELQGCSTGALSGPFDLADCAPLAPPRSVSTPGSHGFQLSAWVDMGLTNGVRGYWEPYGAKASEISPSVAEISNAKDVLRTAYHVNQIYLIYHRQFELPEMQRTAIAWRDGVSRRDAAKLVPTIVLQNYRDHACNFTDAELTELVSWLRDFVNSAAIAVYDIYNVATDPKRDYCGQLELIKRVHRGELHRVGLQPGEPLVAPFDKAVEDTYGAVAAGHTNELWETACGFGPTSARDTLAGWVRERVGHAKVAWNFVIVGFNQNARPPCGIDTADSGDDPVPPGRNWPRAHDAIVAEYPGGGAHAGWAGFSLDIKILAIHSQMTDAERMRFYTALRAGRVYDGTFAPALNEVAGIFARYDRPPTQLSALPSPPARVAIDP